MNIEQIKEKISKLELEEIARTSGFQKRMPRKIDITGLVGGFLLMVLQRKHALSCWARQISRFAGNVLLSKQALDKRLKIHSQLGEQLIQHIVNRHLSEHLQSARQSGLFRFFNAVYLEDSTCLKLPKGLNKAFPGASNRHGQAATARIQLTLDLVKDTYQRIKLTSFTKNDQSYAGEIVSMLKANDLVMRDLGYWSLRVFKQIAVQSAFFLTRYRRKTLVYDEQGTQIDLVKKLKKACKQGITTVDIEVQMGKTERVKGRLVAIKAPQDVVLRRKRAAKKNRDRRLNHDAEYYYLLEWTIFFTNVPAEIWAPKHLFTAYRLRWRIEIVFKAWKSGFQFEHLFKMKKRLQANRARLTIYLFLAVIALFFVRWFIYFKQAVYEYSGNYLCMIKFTDFVKERFVELLIEVDLSRFVPFVDYYFTYEKRKKRYNHEQLILFPLS